MIVRMSRGANTAIVLHPTDSSNVTIDLCVQLGDTSCPLWRKSMIRGEEEAAINTIDRLRILIVQQQQQQQRSANRLPKSTSREELLKQSPPIEVLGSAESDDKASSLVLLDTALSNKKFWPLARQMCIGSNIVDIRYNVPTITSITPPSALYVGVPAVCSGIKTLFASACSVQHEWCERVGNGENAIMRVLSTDAVFTPLSEHVGKGLVVRVSLEGDLGLWTQIDLPSVQPGLPPVDRWRFTAEPLEAPLFRVVTYNVLHDEFCSTAAAKRRLYPYCTDDMLALSYRQSRIVQELLAYHADVICLQECGKKVYQEFFESVFRHYGFEGRYTNKNGSVSEGCACFWRSTRFRLVKAHDFPLNMETLVADHPQLAERVARHGEFKEALQNITSIAAVTVLFDTQSGKKIVVGNTHLFYHANACHIRMLQTFILLHRLKIYMKETSEGQLEEQIPIVFCGDFNFTHSTGGYRLVTTGCTESSHHSWEKGKLFWWGCDRMLGIKPEVGGLFTPKAISTRKETEQVGNSSEVMERKPPIVAFYEDIVAPLVLTDAYGLMDPTMRWTNYSITFREVIDYVFFSPGCLDVVRTIPIPDESELSENVALPNKKYPSDHVSLIVDFKPKST